MNKAELHTIGRAKFVLLQNGDDYLLKSSSGAELHRHIIRQTNFGGHCLGGGRIEIDEKKIYAYGKSLDFGVPPQEKVEEILKEFFGNEMEIVVEMGVGY